MATILNCFRPDFEPLATDFSQLGFGNRSWSGFLAGLVADLPGEWRCDFYPTTELLKKLRMSPSFEVISPDGEIVASAGRPSPERFHTGEGIILVHPWDLLQVAEEHLPQMTADIINGSIHPSAVLDGVIELGSGSRILPGVYIEGNCIIGDNCKIGPNCYLRGNTIIGNNCHIGQAVEIKNSIINSCTNVPHLSYVGDSVIGSGVNFGAGTIVSNFRHDGKNHRTMVNGELLDTGRRKFGSIIGDGVHTGINTSIYPGRKLYPGSSTRPGATVDCDLR